MVRPLRVRELPARLPSGFGRAEFDRLVELGCFGEDDYIELLSGMLVATTPPGPMHTSAVEAQGRPHCPIRCRPATRPMSPNSPRT